MVLSFKKLYARVLVFQQRCLTARRKEGSVPHAGAQVGIGKCHLHHLWRSSLSLSHSLFLDKNVMRARI